VSNQIEAVEHLAVGQWLGTHNRIGSMRWEPSYAAWRVTDSTGVTYYQERMRDGMLVSRTAHGVKVPAPWPPPPKVEIPRPQGETSR
jgi:hypothetical protein